MAFAIARRVFLLRSTKSSLLSSQRSRFSTSRAPKFADNDRIQLSPLFQETGEDGIKGCRIELVDDSTWSVSSGLAYAWRRSSEAASPRTRPRLSDDEHGKDEEEDLDFDMIEDMRVRGKLFYKLDRSSKEYEEHKFDFHGRRSTRNGRDWNGSNEASRPPNSKRDHVREIKKFEEIKNSRNERDWMGSNEASRPPNSKMDHVREIKKFEEIKNARNERDLMGSNQVSMPSNSKKDHVREMKKREEIKQVENSSSWLDQVGDATSSIASKRQRAPTFNQLTAAYHEPFCLDVFISKGSVRACIVHRATSNVVVVAHSISKDMKFDLGSAKNKGACAAVGRLLARRALDDDIHNVVFTPRKGERVEGKLQIVVKSIVDGGVDVKVKLKQRSFKQARHLLPNSPNLRSSR